MANTTGKKHGGRKKGTPNKLTHEIRASLTNILSDEIEQLPKHFEKLEAKERIELLVKIIPYAMPPAKQEGEGRAGFSSMDFNTTAQKLIFKPIDLDVPD